jgi:hypothetical protein
MKFKVFCIALLFVFVFTLGFNYKASASKAQANVPDSIKIVSSDADLKVGDFGFVTIQGKPKTPYTIRTLYKLGDNTYSVQQMRVTDANGKCTFNWFVENGTTPGENTATITGDGQPMDITHVVTQ